MLTVTPTNAEVRLVDDPKDVPTMYIFCPKQSLSYVILPEQGDIISTGESKRRVVTYSKASDSDHSK